VGAVSAFGPSKSFLEIRKARPKSPFQRRMIITVMPINRQESMKANALTLNSTQLNAKYIGAGLQSQA
jgi:hypothetical protein